MTKLKTQGDVYCHFSISIQLNSKEMYCLQQVNMIQNKLMIHTPDSCHGANIVTIRRIKVCHNDYFWCHQCMITSSNGNISALLAFVRGIHRSPVNSPHKGQWRGALMFSLNSSWTNNIQELSKQWRRRWLRRHRTNYDVIVMDSKHNDKSLFIYRHWLGGRHYHSMPKTWGHKLHVLLPEIQVKTQL